MNVIQSHLPSILTTYFPKMHPPILFSAFQVAAFQKVSPRKLNVFPPLSPSRVIPLYFISQVGIATGWLRAGRPRGGTLSPGGGKVFPLLHVTQTGSPSHSASFPVSTGGSFPGAKADHSTPASADVNNTWIYTSTPPYVFMV
jgi:hypothetical protein